MAIQMEMQRGQGIIATLNQLQQFWQGQLVFSKQVQQPVMVMEAQAAIRECAGQIRQCQAEMKRLQGLAHAIQTGR